MMLITILLILFFLLVVYLLLIPIVIYIDTAANKYYIHLEGLAKASIAESNEDLLKIKLKVLFLNFYFYPFRKKRDSIKKIEKRKTKKRSKGISMQTGLRILKSFKVKRFLLEIDTGDCISNAKLYPVFAFLNYKVGGFNINFEGRNQMVLYMQNRPLYIIKSFINF